MPWASGSLLIDFLITASLIHNPCHIFFFVMLHLIGPHVSSYSGKVAVLAPRREEITLKKAKKTPLNTDFPLVQYHLRLESFTPFLLFHSHLSSLLFLTCCLPSPFIVLLRLRLTLRSVHFGSLFRFSSSVCLVSVALIYAHKL